MNRKLDYRWSLRQVMATREMFQTTDLMEPLAQRGIRLSSSQVYRLAVELPERLSLKVLIALLDILDCTMDELIETVTATLARKSKASGGAEAGVGWPAPETCPHHPSRRLIDDAPAARHTCRPARRHCGPHRRDRAALDRRLLEDTVIPVAGGRAKRRRLAQALYDKPSLLTDGHSPAPRVVVDLLIALRKAGAVTISPPVCAECGKLLRTFQRRGEDWYCGVCGPVREPCAACGNTRPVSCRDRERKPRCSQCKPHDGRDPVEIIVDVVTGIDPTLSADVVATAVHAAAPHAGKCQQLAFIPSHSSAYLPRRIVGIS
jgi:hypothetical protein